MGTSSLLKRERHLLSLTHWSNDINLYELKKIHPELICCDIFDTLLFRTTNDPTDIFLEIGKVACEQNVVYFPVSPEEFKHIRIEAEIEARRKAKKISFHSEVNLFEIYKEFNSHFLTDIDRIIKIEIEIEKRNLFINESIRTLLYEYHRKGTPIVLLSDMYLTLDQIKEILQSLQFDLDAISEIMISNMYKASKADGNLYKILLRKYHDILPEKIIHIGDNLQSDFLNATKQGIKSLLYKTINESGTIYEMEQSLDRNIIPELLSLRKLVCSQSLIYDQKEKFWFEFGATIISPLLSTFTEWVVQEANSKKVKHIYPLMREGSILGKLLQNSLHKHNIKGIEVKPLYVSRLSTFLPSLPIMDRQSVEEMIRNDPWATLGKFLDRFNIDNPFPKYEDLELETLGSVQLPDGNFLLNKLVDFLSTTEMLDYINKLITSKFELIQEYLKQNYDLDSPFITVDIGYTGTIQRSLDLILNKFQSNSHAVHLIAIGMKGSTRKLLHGTHLRSFIHETALGRDLWNNNFSPAIIETLAMENIGSTIGYKRIDGKIVPILDTLPAHVQYQEIRSLFLEGLLKFQSLFLDLLLSKPWLLEQVYKKKNSLISTIFRVMDFPTHEEALFLGNLHFENSYNKNNEYESFCPSQYQKLARQRGPDSFLRTKRINNNVWMAGIVEREFPNFFRFKLLKQKQDQTSRMAAELSEYIFQTDIKEACVYGAGQFGLELIKTLNTGNIKLNCIIDRNHLLWGKYMDGVKICSLQEAFELENSNFIIASFAYSKEIRETLEFEADNRQLNIKVFDYNSITPHL